MDAEDDDFSMLILLLRCTIVIVKNKHTVLGYDILCVGKSSYNRHEPFAVTYCMSPVISVLYCLQGYQQNYQITVSGER